MNVIKIKKGLDINLKGKPQEKLEEGLLTSSTYAVRPADFKAFNPKLLKKAGERVKAGTPLAYNKNNSTAKLISPVSGEITEIRRGERRKILEIIIKADEKIEYEKFETENYKDFDAAKIKKLLVDSGLWSVVIQRPFGIVANPADTPKAIYISTFDTAPLSQNYQFTLKEYIEEFQTGIDILKKLTKGKIYLNLDAKISDNIFKNIHNTEKKYFQGPHPTGNVGIQISKITPINKGDIIWTLNPQNVVFIGRFFKKGIVDLTKIIPLTGSQVKEPKYYKIISGINIKKLTENKLLEGNNRIIGGNVLTGAKLEPADHLGFFHNSVSVIPEGNYYEFFGWQKPGFNKFSVSGTYFSKLFPKKEWVIDTNLHGGVRPFVFTGKIDKVLPMDILPTYLLKAILTEDVELMEGLGIYEVIEEDFALCEFVCISKIDIQDIISKGISLMLKEFGH